MRIFLMLWYWVLVIPSLCQFDLSVQEQCDRSTQYFHNGFSSLVDPNAINSSSTGNLTTYYGTRRQSDPKYAQISQVNDTDERPSKDIRKTIYAGVGGYGPPLSLNYEMSWVTQKRAWGLAMGGFFRNVSGNPRYPMSSIHTWQVQVNRMRASRAGFEYGAGFIYSSGMEATEGDTGFPQRLFLGVKPAGLRIPFKSPGVMIRLYGLGLITLHEFNPEWRSRIADRDEPSAFGNAWFFPLSALIGVEIGYTF